MMRPRHPTTMEKLPGEVLSEIFVRLLAKQIAQMRSVCKPWNALISESSFIKSHLHHSLENNDKILLLFDMMFSFESGPSPFTARLSRSPDLELANFIKPPVIPQIKNGYGFVTGSVNGLICFLYGSNPAELVLHIWNPSLSAVLSLPPCPRGSGRFNFGFGFDPKSDDYKILKLTSFFKESNKVEQAEVYSMRKGSWKLISHQTFPSHITILGRNKNQVCVDDNLHWLCETDLQRKRKTILAFDLGSETFREINLSDYLLRRHLIELGVLCGKLCVLSCVKGGECYVWVMDEYGVPESWVKHHAFSQFSGSIYPYGFTSYNEFLFEVDDCFALYDPITGRTKTFKITGGLCISKIVEYVDSLVWVAPDKHELSKGHLLVSILNIHQLLKGLQMAIKGISRFLFRRGING